MVAVARGYSRMIRSSWRTALEMLVAIGGGASGLALWYADLPTLALSLFRFLCVPGCLVAAGCLAMGGWRFASYAAVIAILCQLIVGLFVAAIWFVFAHAPI